ncbi:MAG TPA: protein phosphatase CheZ [Candidatus Cybelea sp.]|nr:protein phosphatase CheZ [Candidatus Cybelea sp.]
MQANAKASPFRQRIERLRAERSDMVPIGDVAEIVESLVASMDGDLSGAVVQMQNELQELSGYIRRAKAEIATIQPNEISLHHLPAVNDELDAVVAATEEATQTFLNAAEKLTTLGAKLGGDAAKEIETIVTRIYEASNFQDITGQRITKVVRTLHHIESKVAALLRAVGEEDAAKGAAPPAAAPAEGDSMLLNGPQLPDKANSQADIDALLASFD